MASNCEHGVKPNAITVIKRKKVQIRTGLSRSTIYARLKPNPKRPFDYDPSFPAPIRLGPKSVGWIESEIDEWLAAQVEKSRGTAQQPTKLAAQVEKRRNLAQRTIKGAK